MRTIDCIEEKLKQTCEVQFSIVLLSIVIACNACKVLLMTIIIRRLNEATLVTIGDAISSFLQRCDPTTEKCCLASRHNVRSLWKNPLLRHNQRWTPRNRKPWFSACSVRRWIPAFLLYIVALSVTGHLYKLSRDAGENIEFGKISARKSSLSSFSYKILHILRKLSILRLNIASSPMGTCRFFTAK